MHLRMNPSYCVSDSGFQFGMSVSLSQETDRSNFKPKLLIGFPKVCDLDVHERKMLNLRCVYLQNCPTIAFAILEREKKKTAGTKKDLLLFCESAVTYHLFLTLSVHICRVMTL